MVANRPVEVRSEHAVDGDPRNTQGPDITAMANCWGARPHATSRAQGVRGPMPSVEVRSTRGQERVVNLTGTAYIVGSDPSAADIVIDDPTTSGVHAVMDLVGPAWLIRDLGARNGTRINGERLIHQRRLKDRDQIFVGRTYWLVFHDGTQGAWRSTAPLDRAPDNITRGEKRVLVELCRPMLLHTTFQDPTSVREIAARLSVGKGAVEAHLANLYDKFGIWADENGGRRRRLADEAVRRGAVTIADLDTGDTPTGQT